MKTTKILSLLAVLVTIMLSSCAKDGKTGPQGPAGANGNANVKSKKETVTIWYNGTTNWYADIFYGEITSTIINSGAVLVYGSDDGLTYIQLPWTYFQDVDYTSTITPEISEGKIRLIAQDSDGVLPNNPGTVTIKIVVIAASAKKELEEKHIDLTDYNQITTYLNM